MFYAGLGFGPTQLKLGNNERTVEGINFTFTADWQPSPNLANEGKALTHSVAADLTNRSQLLKARVEKGDLKIQPALYDLKSGIVHFD
jgi:hypothetical protein